VRVVVNVNTGLPEFYSDVNVVVNVLDYQHPGHVQQFPVGPGHPYTPDYNWCGGSGYSWAGVNNANTFAGAGSYRPDDHCGQRWDGRNTHQQSLFISVGVQVFVNQPPVYVQDVQDCGDHIIVNHTTFVYGDWNSDRTVYIPRQVNPYTVNPVAGVYTSEVPAVFQGYVSGVNPTGDDAQATLLVTTDHRMQYALTGASVLIVLCLGGGAWLVWRRWGSNA
jgi:hypothetical protein